MQAYAAKRNKALKKDTQVKAAPAAPLAAQVGRDSYDAQYDLDTLTRAAAIKADGKRHAAAMAEAKKKQAQLAHVMRKT